MNQKTETTMFLPNHPMAAHHEGEGGYGKGGQSV